MPSYTVVDVKRERKSYAQYDTISVNNLRNGVVVDSAGEAAQMVNNTLYCYSHSRRVMTNRIYNYNSDSNNRNIVIDVPANTQKAIGIDIDTTGIVTGAAGWIRIYLYMLTDVNQALDLIATTERGNYVEEDVQSLAYHWVSVNVQAAPDKTPSGDKPSYLRLAFIAGGTAVQATIKSVSIFEPGSARMSPTYRATNGGSNVLGEDDYPYSAGVSKLLHDNIKACYVDRVSQAHIMNFCTEEPVQSVGTSYSANKDRHGRWVVRKAAGITQIDGIYRGGVSAGAGDARISLWAIGGAEVTSTTVALTTAFPTWFPMSFSLSGLSSDETEYEVRIDAKHDTTTVDSTMSGILMYDHPISSSDIDYRLPSKMKVQSNDDLLSSNVKNIKDTLDQIWTRQGKILLNNYMLVDAAACTSNDTTTGYDDYFPLYVSRGCREIVLRMLLRKPDQTDRWAIDYTGTGNFSGYDTWETVTGGTSGATGICRYDDTTNNILYVSGLNGRYQDGETLTGESSANTATASGVPYKEKVSTGLDVEVSIYGMNNLDFNLDFTEKPHGVAFPVELRIPIPAQYWNDVTISGTYIQMEVSITPDSYSANVIDFVYPVQITAFEQPRAILYDELSKDS